MMVHNKKKTPIRVEFGRKLRLKRHERELSQEQLAEMANLHPTYVGSVERGERNIALENIVILSRALDCIPGDLMPE